MSVPKTSVPETEAFVICVVTIAVVAYTYAKVYRLAYNNARGSRRELVIAAIVLSVTMIVSGYVWNILFYGRWNYDMLTVYYADGRIAFTVNYEDYTIEVYDHQLYLLYCTLVCIFLATFFSFEALLLTLIGVTMREKAEKTEYYEQKADYWGE